MDYEKKKRLMELKNNMISYGYTDGAEELESIFPELKENEDEKIRNFLIDILSHGTWLKEWPFGPNEVVDWLKRQKVSSMSATEVLVRAGLKPYKDGDQWCILVGDNIQEGICGFGNTIDEALYQFLINILERLEEQKSISSETKFESIDNSFRRGRMIGFREGVECIKQSAEWGEEDKLHLNNAILAAESDWGC